VLTVFAFAKLGFIKLGFLWLNPIGAFGVILFTLLFNLFFRAEKFSSVREP